MKFLSLYMLMALCIIAEPQQGNIKPPELLSISKGQYGEVTLRWIYNGDPDAFQINKTLNGVTVSNIVGLHRLRRSYILAMQKTTWEYTDTKNKQNGSYTYSVKVHTQDGSSVNSNELNLDL